MLGVFAVLVAAATLVALEASFVYYKLPSTPLWLRERKGVQTTLSSTLSNGFVVALFMMVQYLVNLGEKPFVATDLALMGVVVAGGVMGWRWVRTFARRFEDETAPARAPGADAIHGAA